jgi:hypothetical protein
MKSLRALVLIGMAIGAAIANPVDRDVDPMDLQPRQDETTDPCATTLCLAGNICAVLGGEAHCLPSAPERCGTEICKHGTKCCFPDCGVCSDEDYKCPTESPCTVGPVCGPSVCPVGEVCCNESCGICSKPGGVCIQLFCGEELGLEEGDVPPTVDEGAAEPAPEEPAPEATPA